MKKSIWSRIGDFLMGKGFYMVLLLCVMAIGGSGYYLYQLASDTLEGQEQPVSGQAQVEVSTQEVPESQVNQELADALAQAQAEADQETQAIQEAKAAQENQTAQAEAQETEPAAQTESEETAQAQTEPEAAQETAEAPEAEETLAEEPEPAQETAQPVDTVEEPSQTTFAPPVEGELVAAFSDQELTYNAALEDWRTHSGVDLAAQVGDPVSAALDGQVLEVKEDYLLGTTITLNHGDGLMTVYGNLDPEVSVEQGDTVVAGETLGSVGTSAQGEAHEGAWLHFAVTQDGVPVDPADYLE